jgi:putative membrane protein
MILEIAVALLIGLVLGVIAGLIPGLHINLISSFIVLALPFLILHFSPLAIILFIVSMSITTIFLDFIPSTFLGAPEEETALSILPSQELLLKGKANTAIFLSSLGSLVGIIISFILIPLFFIFLKTTYSFFEKMMFFILIWIAILILIDNKNILLAISIAIISGFLGIASLNLGLSQPLLPLLTGLYGISGLIFSINQKAIIPEQQEKIEKPEIKSIIRPAFVSFLVSPLCSFLPGLGSSQATIISSRIFGEIKRKQFILMNGAINMVISVLSIVTLIIINKSRTGSAAAISQVGKITTPQLIIILFSILIVGILSFFITLRLSKFFSNRMNKIDYPKLSKILIAFLTLVVFLITGLRGLLVLSTSTCLGLACQYLGVRKGILMFCLLIPTILYYLPF